MKLLNNIRKLSLIFFLNFAFVINANALCPTVGQDKESKDEFVIAIIQSLVSIKENHDILMSDMPIKKNQSLTDEITDVLVHLKTANKKLDCAKEQVERFKVSKNEIMNVTSNSIFSSISSLMKFNELQQENIKKKLDGSSIDSEGNKAEQDANARMELKAAWEQLAQSVSLATHIIPDEKDQKFSSVSEKIIKSSKRLISENFSKKELSKPKEWVDLSASAFHKVLSYKWKYKK